MAEDVFCKILSGEIKTDFLIENKTLVVFKDIKPKAPVHYLVVSRKHIETIDDAGQNDVELLGQMILAGKEAAGKLGLVGNYKLVFNVGKGGGQEIFHLHLHLLGGW